MQPESVVQGDPAEDQGARLSWGAVVAAVDQLDLEGDEERLGDGVDAPLIAAFLKRGIVCLSASCSSCRHRADEGTAWPGHRCTPDHPPTRPRNAPCASWLLPGTRPASL